MTAQHKSKSKSQKEPRLAFKQAAARSGKVSLGKDAPFPIWTPLPPRSGKDAPFPLIEAGLDYERVAFTVIYQGTYGPKMSITEVVHSREQFERVAPELRSVVDVNRVDFDADDVILIGLGERPTNGYLVRVDDVIVFSDQLGRATVRTLVHYTEQVTSPAARKVRHPSVCVGVRKLPEGEAQFISGSL